MIDTEEYLIGDEQEADLLSFHGGDEEEVEEKEHYEQEEGCTESELCGFMPLFQDLDFSDEPPEIQELIGKAVACSVRLKHKCYRTDQQWVHSAQQLAFQLLLKRQQLGLHTKSEYLDKQVLERINKDSERFDSPRLKNPGAVEVCTNGKQPKIKKTVHSLEHQEAEIWTIAQPIYKSELHEQIQELYECGVKPWRIAKELGVNKRKVYRKLDENASSEVTHGRTEKRNRPRVPWSAVARLLKEPEVPRCPTHIPKDEWPSPRSKLYSLCHCEGESDKRLIDHYLAGKPLDEPAKNRLRELAYNRSNL